MSQAPLVITAGADQRRTVMRSDRCAALTPCAPTALQAQNPARPSSRNRALRHMDVELQPLFQKLGEVMAPARMERHCDGKYCSRVHSDKTRSHGLADRGAVPSAGRYSTTTDRAVHQGDSFRPRRNCATQQKPLFQPMPAPTTASADFLIGIPTPHDVSGTSGTDQGSPRV